MNSTFGVATKEPVLVEPKPDTNDVGDINEAGNTGDDTNENNGELKQNLKEQNQLEETTKVPHEIAENKSSNDVFVKQETQN